MKVGCKTFFSSFQIAWKLTRDSSFSLDFNQNERIQWHLQITQNIKKMNKRRTQGIKYSITNMSSTQKTQSFNAKKKIKWLEKGCSNNYWNRSKKDLWDDNKT